jgi:outer membrane lipoprotein-sorting protein
MKIIFIFILNLAGLLALSAQNDFTPVASTGDIMKQIQEASSSLLTLESDFTQTKYLDILGENVVSEGKFFYKKDRKICLDYRIPAEYQVIINKEKMKITSSGKVSVYELKKNKAMAQMNQLMTACLTGDLNSLASSYRFTIEENHSQYRILLQPLKKEKSSIQSLDVWMDKKDFSVQQLQIVETSNDSTIYTFTGKKKNVPVSDTKFNI